MKTIQTDKFRKLSLDLNTFPSGGLDIVDNGPSESFMKERDTADEVKKKWKRRKIRHKKKNTF